MDQGSVGDNSPTNAAVRKDGEWAVRTLEEAAKRASLQVQREYPLVRGRVDSLGCGQGHHGFRFAYPSLPSKSKAGLGRGSI